MRRVLLALLLACCGAAHAQDATLRVLFVGNSLTYVNDLPHVLARLGELQPAPVRIETRTFVAPGGTLDERRADGVAIAALAEGGWDAVVLQERGGVPACLASADTRGGADCRRMLAAHRAFADAARAGNARVIVLETWAGGEAAQATLHAGTVELARRTHAQLVHCGDALIALARGDGRRAVFPDGLHPAPAATVVMAAQLLRALTGTPPRRADGSYDMATPATIDPARPLERQPRAPHAFALDPSQADALLARARRYR